MNKKLELEKVILTFMAILILFPSTIKIYGISIIKISTIIIFMIFVLIIYNKKINIIEMMKNNYFILSMLYPLAIFLSLLININNIHMNDLFEIIRYFMYFMIIAITYYICKEQKYYIFLLRITILLLIIMCLYGIIQYFNLFSLNEKIVKIYAPTQYITLVNDYSAPRVISTKPNPAVYGVVVSIGIYINLLYLKLNKKSKLAYICICLCIINLMMTLTRTIQIAFMASIVCYLFIKLYKFKGCKVATLGSGMMIAVLIILIMVLPDSITWRLKSIVNLSSTTSWTGRIDKWQEYIKIIKENILFGSGPIKNQISKIGYIDSEWIQTMYQYGIVGIIGYMGMLILPLYYIIRNDEKRNNIEFYVPILIMIFINNIAASSTISFDTCIVICIFIGMIFNSTRKIGDA